MGGLEAKLLIRAVGFKPDCSAIDKTPSSEASSVKSESIAKNLSPKLFSSASALAMATRLLSTIIGIPPAIAIALACSRPRSPAPPVTTTT
jgi:hypothetical protein